MTVDELSVEDITAKIRLLVDQETVHDVTFDAEVDGRDRVLVTVGVEGAQRARTFELQIHERT